MPKSKDKPLKGVGVLVTRAEDQSAGMIRQLKEMGAAVHPFPVIVIEPVEEPPGLQSALDRVSSYDGVIFTSANGVKTFAAHLKRAGIDPQDVPEAVCVGPRTGEAWSSEGGRVSQVPRRFSGEGIVDLLGPDLKGRSYLLLRPEVVKTDLAGLLSRRGASIDQLVLYRTVINPGEISGTRGLLESGEIEVVTFTSPSSVEGLIRLLGSGRLLEPRICLCIGPTTAKKAIEEGLKRVYHPEEFTVEGMLQLLPALIEGGDERRMK